MNVRDFECRSYEQAMELLGGKIDRKVCNNTALEYREDRVFVFLHGHAVVNFFRDGRITIASCGYRTVTTKDRINRCLPYPWQVRQIKDEWWLWNNRYAMGNHQEGDVLKVSFVDRMTVPGTGPKSEIRQ